MAAFKDARERWDRRYTEAEGFLFGEAPNAWLAQADRWLPPGGEALCIADGEGRNGVCLARRGHPETAFDRTEVAIGKARAFARANGVSDERLRLMLAELGEWIWAPEAFDLVVAVYFQFADPARREATVAGIRRTLRPGGVLVIEGFGPRQLRHRTGGPGVLENLYTTPMLLDAFPGWEILATRDADAVLHEGPGHDGLAHVVSMVLRKPL